MSTKIYSDDPSLPYKTTKLTAGYTKMEIDGLFAKWGIKDVYWHDDKKRNDVFVQFKIVETIDGSRIEVAAKVEAPTVWDHKTRNKAEAIDWNISFRVLYWFLKTHIEAAYLARSSKTVAFLPYLTSSDGKTTLAKILIPHLEDLDRLKALPYHSEQERKIIEVEANESL